MKALIEAEESDNRRGTSENQLPLQADPTFDIWSVGVVMYRVTVQQSLLESDDRLVVGDFIQILLPTFYDPR